MFGNWGYVVIIFSVVLIYAGTKENKVLGLIASSTGLIAMLIPVLSLMTEIGKKALEADLATEIFTSGKLFEIFESGFWIPLIAFITGVVISAIMPQHE